jgi:AcrR family transcriptional regulator
MSTSLAAVPRRTQAERSASTRARLMAAALASLADRGYAATTTTAVAERAGVSRGAQLHHFPTRAALVAAAVEHLFARLTDEYREAFARLEPSPDRLSAAVDLLWSMFDRPLFPAALELFVAARTDPELHAQVLRVSERHRDNVTKLAREYFPELARDQARFEAVLATILDAMHGMAISRIVYGSAAPTAAVLEVLRQAANTLTSQESNA